MTTHRKAWITNLCERYKKRDPDAWYELLIAAISSDPDIPENTKTALRASLIQHIDGENPLDRIPQWRRRRDAKDAAIYSAVTREGGNATDAYKAVAKQFSIGIRTVSDAYKRHMSRWKIKGGLDGRRKNK